MRVIFCIINIEHISEKLKFDRMLYAKCPLNINLNIVYTIINYTNYIFGRHSFYTFFIIQYFEKY